MQEKLNDIFRKIQEISVNYGCVEYLSAELGVLKEQIEEFIEEMQAYEQDVRDKAIDDFAEKLLETAPTNYAGALELGGRSRYLSANQVKQIAEQLKI